MFCLCVLILVQVFLFTGSIEVTFDEIQRIGTTCGAKDNCRIPYKSMYDDLRSCECDPKCNTFNDCCADAPFRSSDRKGSSEIRCLRLGGHSEVFGISKCKPGWPEDNIIRERCEKDYRFFRYPIDNLPVTDPDTEITYKNRYCAACNGVENIFFWQIIGFNEELENITEEFVIDKIEFSESYDSWGLWLFDGVEDVFYPYRILYVIPPYFSTQVRMCHVGTIESCPDDWEDDIIREKCDAYMGTLVIGEQEIYRNVHCAMCNNASLTEYGCDFGYPYGYLPSFFTVLVDFNIEFSDISSEKRHKCEPEQQFDPFSKKCRYITCGLEGYPKCPPSLL